MSGFKLICSKCNSDKVIQVSEIKRLDSSEAQIDYGEGIQRKCLDCDNESFVFLKTWHLNKNNG